MSMTISIRVEHKSASKTKGQRSHDHRTGNIPKYVDRSMIHENSTIIKTVYHEARLQEIAETRRGQKQRSMKKDAAISTAGIITFGNEAQGLINDLPRETQDQLYLTITKRLSEKLLGSIQINSLVAHRDESAPHAHFVFPSFRSDGIPLSKFITPTIAAELQDIAGDVCLEFGLPIFRGEKKHAKIDRLRSEGKSERQISRAVIHRSVKQLHHDLPQEIKEKEEELAKIQEMEQNARTQLLEKIAELEKFKQKIEDNERYLLNAINKEQEKIKDIQKHEKNIETYERRANQARSDAKIAQDELMEIYGISESDIKNLLKQKSGLEPNFRM